MQHLLARPLEGRQVGLIAAGTHQVSFSEFAVWGSRPKAFVVMQFAERYDMFYQEVIKNQAEAAGFEVVRIDEKAGPGVIFQDIQPEIEQADIIIAEVTPANPNVFYELGYAHALAKPTILLARKGAELPFDIKSFRVVFYSDTIGGKTTVERDLRIHLEAIAAAYTVETQNPQTHGWPERFRSPFEAKPPRCSASVTGGETTPARDNVCVSPATQAPH
jgi:nucleoside 2-deoxyribosyltransferase